MILRGYVDESNTLLFEDLDEVERVFKRFAGKRVTVDVRKEEKARSLPQNNYLWGVIYKLIGNWSGHTKEELHDFFKAKFLTSYLDLPNGERAETVGSTAGLSTVEFMDFCEKVRLWALDYGILIPLPGDSGIDWSESPGAGWLE